MFQLSIFLKICIQNTKNIEGHKITLVPTNLDHKTKQILKATDISNTSSITSLDKQTVFYSPVCLTEKFQTTSQYHLNARTHIYCINSYGYADQYYKIYCNLFSN
jgi:hypothetical protein